MTLQVTVVLSGVLGPTSPAESHLSVGLRNRSIVGGPWNHRSPQWADKSLAQHRTQASLVGVHSGISPYLGQMLRLELSDPSGAVCLKTALQTALWQRLPASENQDYTLYHNWVETGFTSLAYLPCMIPFHIIKNRDLVLFFFFIKNLLRWCNYRLFFKNYLQLTGPEKRHLFFVFFFSFLLHSFDSVPYKPHTS